MRTVEISVTAAHIAYGKQKDCEKCPVALALHELMPYMALIEVDNNFVGFYSDADDMTLEATVQLPAKAENFIRAFDEGEPAGPFTFTMQVPEEVPPR